MPTERSASTNRIQAYTLEPVSCALCGEMLGYAEASLSPQVWCEHCAKQEENAEDLK